MERTEVRAVRPRLDAVRGHHRGRRAVGDAPDVQIVDAGQPGRERLLCATNVGACDEMWSRMRAAINSLDPHAAGGSMAAGEQMGTVLPFRRRNGERP